MPDDEHTALLENQQPQDDIDGSDEGSVETVLAGTQEDAAPPAYEETLRLVPMTSDQSRRYDKQALSAQDQPIHVSIRAGLFSTIQPEILALPTGWHEYIHPEGQKYFYNPTRRVVTDSNVRKRHVFELIRQSLGLVDALILRENIVLQATTELMLELDETDVPPTCRYYLVDHNHKTEFWLEDTSTDSMNLPPVTSMPHLKYLLRQHYWTHIEFYPLHLSLAVDVEEELLGILTHACIDFMTSDLSTVPYNAEQCREYLRLIQKLPDTDRTDGYRNCVLARVWAEIDGNYFVNLHGEDTPRLSRTQRLLPAPVVQSNWMIVVLRQVLLRTPDYYYNLLNELWVDKISYAAHWQQFMTSLINEWKAIGLWSLVFLVSDTMIFTATTITSSQGLTTLVIQASSLGAVFVSLTSLAATLVLLKRHRGQTEAGASEAGEYLETYFHPRFGHQPLAIFYAIPWATCMWSFACMTMSVVAMSFELKNAILTAIAWCLLLILSVTIYFSMRTLQARSDEEEEERRGVVVSVKKALKSVWSMISRRSYRLFFPSFFRYQAVPQSAV